MEPEEKNSYLFYLIGAIIVLGFIASLALPIRALEHRTSDTSPFAGHFVPPLVISRQQADVADGWRRQGRVATSLITYLFPLASFVFLLVARHWLPYSMRNRHQHL